MSDISEQILIEAPSLANSQLADPSLLNFYKDLENRTYWLTDEICSYTLDLVQYIIRWNREDKDTPIEERKPIKLIIDDMGGSLDVSQTITQLIKLSKTPVYAYGLGTIASGASLIYLACHKRFALPNSAFILHKGSCNNLGGNYEEMQAFMKDYEKQVNELTDFYAKHTKFTPKEISENIRTDWYIRLPLAQEKGIVDEIIDDIDLFF